MQGIGHEGHKDVCLDTVFLLVMDRSKSQVSFQVFERLFDTRRVYGSLPVQNLPLKDQPLRFSHTSAGEAAIHSRDRLNDNSRALGLSDPNGSSCGQATVFLPRIR